MTDNDQTNASGIDPSSVLISKEKTHATSNSPKRQISNPITDARNGTGLMSARVPDNKQPQFSQIKVVVPKQVQSNQKTNNQISNFKGDGVQGGSQNGIKINFNKKGQ